MSDPRAKFLGLLDKVIAGEEVTTTEATELKEVFKPWAEKTATTATGAIADANKLRDENTAIQSQLKELQEQAEANGGDLTKMGSLEKQVEAMAKKLELSEQKEADLIKSNSLAKMKSIYSDGLNLNPKYKKNLVDNMVNSGVIIEQNGEIGALVDNIFTSAADHMKLIEADNTEFVTPAKGANPPAKNTLNSDAGKYAGMTYLEINATRAAEE